MGIFRNLLSSLRPQTSGGRRTTLLLTVLVAFLAIGPAAAAPGHIRTIAGGGITDGPNGEARVRSPGGLTLDASGNLIFSDLTGMRVRRLSSGKATTLGGNGSEGYAGDGGPALRAMFDHPTGVDMDPHENILVADNENNRIRRISPDGVVTTVAGSPRPILNLNTGDGGPATEATFGFPYDVAAAPDGGFFFSAGNYIRRVDSSGRISTYAGIGLGGYDPMVTDARLSRISTPYAIDLASDGSLYFVDRSTHVLRRISTSGVISTIAGNGISGFSGDGGPATLAQLNTPTGVEVATDGSILLSDMHNQRIRRIGPDGTITTIAGTGTAGSSGDGGPGPSASLNYPRHLQLASDGTIYIAEAQRIRAILPDGTMTTIVLPTGPISGFGFGGDGQLGTEATLYSPSDMAPAPDGSVYIADYLNHRIRKLEPSGTIKTFAGTGAHNSLGDGGPASQAGLLTPRSLLLDNQRGILYVSQYGGHRIRAIDLATSIITTAAGTGTPGINGDGGPATSAQISRPAGMALSADGALFFTEGLSSKLDATGNRVRRIGPDGVITTVAGIGTWGFSGDGGPATSAKLFGPMDVSVAPDGTIYIADSYNDAIRRIGPHGIIDTVVGRGREGQSCGGWDGIPGTMTTLSWPTGVGFGPDGLMYIADTHNSRVRRVDENGLIETVAGVNCAWTFWGDGGPATSAAMNGPSSFAFDSSGGMLIADTGNHRIRYVEGPIP